MVREKLLCDLVGKPREDADCATPVVQTAHRACTSNHQHVARQQGPGLLDAQRREWGGMDSRTGGCAGGVEQRGGYQVVGTNICRPVATHSEVALESCFLLKILHGEHCFGEVVSQRNKCSVDLLGEPKRGCS